MESPVPKTDTPSATPPALPRISDYWPDAPQRLGPPADHYELPGVDATRTGPALHTRPAPGDLPEVEATGAGPDPHTLPGPGDLPGEDPAGTRWIGDPGGRTGKDWKPVVLLAAVAVLAGGAVFAAVSYARSDRGTPSALPAPPLPAPTAEVTPAATPPVSIAPSPPAAPKTVVPPPATARTPPPVPDSATFELVSGVTQLRVAIGDVDGGFFRVGVGDDTTITAKAVFDDGTLKVTTTPNGRKKGSARVEVLLSRDVKWSLRMRGGVREAGIDLSRGRVGAIELIGGAATVDLSVPDQMETIPVVERGGIGTWRIVTDGKEAVRAFFRKGAGSVTFYGDTDTTVDTGDTLRTGQNADLRIDSEGGVGALTVQGR
ncbi:hypothetical protein Acy02nite_73490 [Actinoplanes cyaneus]|uniref:Uncharacterized protein n=1 Tax=Actinoplanes cyaneus TaxID=52696 RepID=A0A919IQ82_9ACTN|nr:hypothetical protein [Actinoplanes cyaneus]MCW2135533.1 hypothetical protein [Actinoplanes cyaneus]GID69468.1 hypothetical protein Acy02nite_73490 [Actinoplanes cyaneus]